MSCSSNMRRILTLCRFHSPTPPSHDRTDLEDSAVNGGNTIEKSVRYIRKRLYYAALKGDWEIAKSILRGNRNYGRERITKTGETVVHIAAAGKNTRFVRKLVEMLDPSDLELRNNRGSTAFCYAAVSGVVENVRVMMKKNDKLPTIRDYDEFTPIQQAVLKGHKKMVSYLYEVTPFEELLQWERIELLDATVRNDMFDMALNILNRDNHIATAKLEGDESLLRVLARKPLAVIDENQEGNWGLFLDAKKKAGQLFEKILTECFTLPDAEFSSLIRSTQILHYAAKEGNAEFLIMILRKNPDLLWELNEEGQTIFHVAVLHRQEKVFNIIYNIGVFKDLITLIRDQDGNNILHLAAKVENPSPSKDTPQGATSSDNRPQQPRDECSKEVEMILPKSLLNLSTAVLQVQREVAWFKEVKRIVPPSFLDMKNNNDKTPEQLFTEGHTAILKKGVKSIRESAKTCLVVAALISTMSFSSAIKLADVVPLSTHRFSTIVYKVFDGTALFMAAAAIIMFLSITSCYTEDDFSLLSLMLQIGVTALCFSISSMFAVFAVQYFLSMVEENFGS